MADLIPGLRNTAGGGDDAQLPFDPKALSGFFAGGTQPQQPQQTLTAPDWFNPIGQKIRQAEGTTEGTGYRLYGGKEFTPGHDHPGSFGAVGPTGQPTSAAGPFQWEKGTWQIEVKRAKQQGVDLDFSNPQHQNWAAFDLASRTYKDHTGRSLEEDQKNGTVNLAALSDQWEGLGSRNPAAVHRELQNNVFGAPNESAREFSNEMIKSVRAAEERYDAAMRKADTLSDFAMANERKMLEAAMQPPKNNHEAWNTWGTAASFLALVGGALGGRHFTNALGAAGAMMQAAETADRGAYDRAYGQWKDQRDFGFRATELLVREANEAVARAGQNYSHQIAALETISKAYELPRTLDHQMLADTEQKLRVEELMAQWHDRQNRDAEVRLAGDEKDAKWSRENGGAPVPAEIHNQHLGEAQRERAGTGSVGNFQILIDPTNSQPYRYNPQTGEATTLDKQPYTPGGAAKLGTGAGAGVAISDSDAQYWANILKAGGHFPPGFARAMGPGSVQKIMAKVPGGSGDAGAFIANNAIVKADSQSLAAITKMTDAATSFERTASQNFDLALKLSKDAVPTDWGPWLNKWIETGETQAGNTNVPPYVAAMLTGANEYAKIMSGSTGAQGATVDSRREAAELFSPYLSKGQIERVVAVAKADMENRKQSLYGQIDDIKARLRTAGSGEPTATQGQGPQVPIARPEVGGPIIKYDAQGNRVQ